MTGSEVVMKLLERHGVEVIFGHPGGAIMPIYDALYDSPIKHVLVRHEQGGAHMADAYYRASGKVGVCFATSGPGATNLVTGLATAMMDSSAVVAITGNVASGLIGTDAFQEADVYGITGPVTKHNYLVKRVEELPQVLAEAFHIASTGRPGPVLVDVPKDVQLAKYDGPLDSEIDLPGYKPTIVGHAGQIRKAAEAVRAAKRPVMIVGGGGQVVPREVAELVERTGIPVITTLMGIGAYPPAAEESLGMPGMHGTVSANKAISHCDLILGAGLRFDDRVTGKISRFAPNATVVHIDIDPAEIGKNIETTVPVVGDARQALALLNAELEDLRHDEWLESIAEWRRTPPYRPHTNDAVLQPQFVMERLHEAMQGSAIVVTDVGQHQMWAAQYFKCNKPNNWVTSGGLGTMGFGVPAALGAALARPDEEVWAIVGDGGVQMTLFEFATLVQEQANVNVVIINNGYLGMVRQWQQLFHDRNYSETFISQPDFQMLATAYGMAARTITSRDDVDEAIEWAREIVGPTLLNFVVEQEMNVYPMIPSGGSYGELIEKGE